METMKRPIKVSSLIELLKAVHNQDAEVYITTAESPRLAPLYADTLIMEVVDDEDMLIIDSNEYAWKEIIRKKIIIILIF